MVQGMALWEPGMTFSSVVWLIVATSVGAAALMLLLGLTGVGDGLSEVLTNLFLLAGVLLAAGASARHPPHDDPGS
jgi:hypothetical protein